MEGIPKNVIQTDAKRRESIPYEQKFFPLERIEVKPSAELIPDIYERENNEKFAVKIIYSKNDAYGKNLIDCLKKLKFNVDAETVENLDTKSIQLRCIEIMETKKEQLEQEKSDGLLVIFLKLQLYPATMREIWGEFSSFNCPSLKDKPKLFIFQNMDQVRTDSIKGRRMVHPEPYDTPVEGDILIIYDSFIVQGTDFLYHLCESIEDYGHQEDLISLVTISNGSSARPVVVSTLTKKFYFTTHEHKGSHYDILDNHQRTKDYIDKIGQYIDKTKATKPKRPPSFRGAPKKTSRNSDNSIQEKDAQKRVQKTERDTTNVLRNGTSKPVTKPVERPPWR